MSINWKGSRVKTESNTDRVKGSYTGVTVTVTVAACLAERTGVVGLVLDTTAIVYAKLSTPEKSETGTYTTSAVVKVSPTDRVRSPLLSIPVPDTLTAV